jgi:5-(aminomethyl)-3-furanmethanol phosphate kinase
MQLPCSLPKNLVGVIKLIDRVVIKIGGATLFHPAGFKAELCALSGLYSDAQVWVIVGGGELVEAMRTVHRLVPELNEEEMHWRCVELLDHTWSITKEIFPIGSSIASREELSQTSEQRDIPGFFLVRVQSFYSRTSCSLLPSSWQPKSNWRTTTDSLAWLLAKIIGADRVILVKQCECDSSLSLAQASELGVIDQELPHLVDANPGSCPTIEFRLASLRSSVGDVEMNRKASN